MRRTRASRRPRGRSTRGRGLNNRPGHDAVIIERRSKAIDFRRKGRAYRWIANELHCGLQTAWSDVQEVLAESNALNAERAEELRALEVERLDGYLVHLQPEIDGEDKTLKLRAIGIALDVSARRSKLLGIDVPPTGPSTADIMAEAARLVTIIQSHIHDQRILDAIADELESSLARLGHQGPSLLPAAPANDR